MATTLKLGTLIRVAVPIDPTDQRPISQRQTRESMVLAVREDGTIEEGEGSVKADRRGLDWEIMEEGGDGEGQAGLVVVRTSAQPGTAGVVLGTLLRVAGNSVEIYTEQTTPPGIMVIPSRACGRSWDWLKGRGLAEVAKSLVEVWTASAPGRTPPETQGQQEGKKRRGRKPRGETPASQQGSDSKETVSAADVDRPAAGAADAQRPAEKVRFEFQARVEIWTAAHRLLQEVVEAERWEDHSRLQDAIVEMSSVLKQVRRG